MNASGAAEWLCVKDLARMLSLSVRTIWRWRKAGRLPSPLVIEGTVRWEAAAIRDWMSARVQELSDDEA